MSQTSTLLSLPYIQPAQAQKHVTHNEALRILDALVQLSVGKPCSDRSRPPARQTARDTSSPAAQPATGPVRIMPLQLYEGSGWITITPNTGWRTWVEDEGRRWSGRAVSGRPMRAPCPITSGLAPPLIRSTG